MSDKSDKQLTENIRQLTGEVSHLTGGISHLTHELRELGQQWKHESPGCGDKPATQEDLKETEARLSALITEGTRPPRVRFEWAIGPVKNKPRTQVIVPMEIKITNEQEIDVTLSPKTDTGKAAALDGMPAWTQISGSGSIRVADNGLSATLVSGDDPGDTEFIVKADANMGTGPDEVEEISEIIKLIVGGATAKNLGITVGTARAKAVAPVPV